MVTNTTHLVRRISTGLIRLALAAIGAVAVGSLFPPDLALAQGSDRNGAAAIVGKTTSNGRISAVEHAQRGKEAGASPLISEGQEAQVVQNPPSPTPGAPSPSDVAREPFKDCDVCPEMVVVPGGVS